MPFATDSLWLLAGLGYEGVPWYGNTLVALWLWCFGANVGSFMNVVVYRVPLGRSVVHPGSRCPSCRQPIRWYDNVPVISWLCLRARCRHCGVTISSRYPLVETLVAAVFLVVAFLSPIRMGENLPEKLLLMPVRFQDMLSLWLMYAFHMLLFCSLICAALIRYDGHSPPRRLFLPALLVGIVAPLIWPSLRPVPLHVPVEFAEPSVALLDAIAGLAVGTSLGWFVVLSARKSGWRSLQRFEVAAPMLVGLMMGWQAACAVTCFASVANLLCLLAGRLASWPRRIPWTAHLTAGAMLYLLCWRPIVDHAAWLGSQATVATFAVAALAAAGLSWLTSLVIPADPPETNSPLAAAEKQGERSMSHESHVEAILNSPSYRLAERDTEFLQRDELRPVRVQLELLKPELTLAEQGIHSTIVAFGGTQIVEHDEAVRRVGKARRELAEKPDDRQLQRAVQRAERVLAKSKYYDSAREFARLVSATCQRNDECDFVIITGGGPGVMEAANRGALDVGAKSIGLNIILPAEQVPNPYITPELCFQFHYFALRKMHFLMRAKALVVFPGGFGTLDELFDALTLRQTNRMQQIPIVLFGKDYWDRVIDFQFLADEGVIADEHLQLIQFAETPEEAWELISAFHGLEREER